MSAISVTKNPPPIGIIKVANGYMVTEGKSMYETPYEKLMVFESMNNLIGYIKNYFS